MLPENKTKIVLIIPNSRWFGKRPWKQMPYAALILTALLKDEFSFHILDANGNNLDAQQCQEYLCKINPEIVMVTGGSVEYHRQAHQAFVIARTACPNAITILGGVYLGISLGANFVIGNPGETWEEIRQSFKFAEECDFDVAHFHIATPLPRTHLYKICQEKNYLPVDFSFTDPKFFGYGVGHITTEEFTPFELAVVRAFEWDRINFISPEKQQRVAELYQTTVEQLAEHRKQTRRKLGVHF